MNPEEVNDWRYITLSDLEKEINLHPDLYTPWLKICMPQLKQYLTSN
jgi:isopentenyl-diphosphate delta-isomerase